MTAAYPITVDQLLALEQQGYFVPPPSGYVFYAVVDTAADIKSLTTGDIATHCQRSRIWRR